MSSPSPNLVPAIPATAALPSTPADEWAVGTTEILDAHVTHTPLGTPGPVVPGAYPETPGLSVYGGNGDALLDAARAALTGIAGYFGTSESTGTLPSPSDDSASAEDIPSGLARPALPGFMRAYSDLGARRSSHADAVPPSLAPKPQPQRYPTSSSFASSRSAFSASSSFSATSGIYASREGGYERLVSTPELGSSSLSAQGEQTRIHSLLEANNADLEEGDVGLQPTVPPPFTPIPPAGSSHFQSRPTAYSPIANVDRVAESQSDAPSLPVPVSVRARDSATDSPSDAEAGNAHAYFPVGGIAFAVAGVGALNLQEDQGKVNGSSVLPDERQEGGEASMRKRVEDLGDKEGRRVPPNLPAMTLSESTADAPATRVNAFEVDGGLGALGNAHAQPPTNGHTDADEAQRAAFSEPGFGVLGRVDAIPGGAHGHTDMHKKPPANGHTDAEEAQRAAFSEPGFGVLGAVPGPDNAATADQDGQEGNGEGAVFTAHGVHVPREPAAERGSLEAADGAERSSDGAGSEDDSQDGRSPLKGKNRHSRFVAKIKEKMHVA
ncbi:hypothetical protein B0H11DRAFT_1954971 [Mycena galericulata]|nr:hypothetical protein B0H11DRAFT_1954971 [Mycena galericulata]